MRSLACTLVLAVLLPACSLGRRGDVQASLAPQPSTRPSDQPPSHVPAGGVDRPVRTPGVRPGGDDTPEATPSTRPNDEGPLGANAFLYLNRRASRLVVEIDAEEGFAPSGAVVDLLRQRLDEVADKPGGIVIPAVETIPGQADGVWTNDDLHASAIRHRDRYSSPDEMVIYLQFVDGRYVVDGAFGVTYTASQAAIFSGHMRDSSSLLVSEASLTKACVVHEVGHLLSLVSLGYRSPRDREDAEHPNHSTNPDSVMFWAVDNVGILGLLGGNAQPPTAFDDADKADLADVATGKLA